MSARVPLGRIAWLVSVCALGAAVLAAREGASSSPAVPRARVPVPVAEASVSRRPASTRRVAAASATSGIVPGLQAALRRAHDRHIAALTERLERQQRDLMELHLRLADLLADSTALELELVRMRHELDVLTRAPATPAPPTPPAVEPDPAPGVPIEPLGVPADATVRELIRMLQTHRDFYRRLEAATALGQRGVADAVPALIAALADADDLVRTAVAEALNRITGQDFGFRSGLGLRQRSRIQARWRGWWALYEDEVRTQLGQSKPAK